MPQTGLYCLLHISFPAKYHISTHKTYIKTNTKEHDLISKITQAFCEIIKHTISDFIAMIALDWQFQFVGTNKVQSYINWYSSSLRVEEFFMMETRLETSVLQ